MDAQKLEQMLVGLLEAAAHGEIDHQVGDAFAQAGAKVRSFEEAGLLCSDNGVVVRIGRVEFQVSIVRSR